MYEGLKPDYMSKVKTLHDLKSTLEWLDVNDSVLMIPPLIPKSTAIFFTGIHSLPSNVRDLFVVSLMNEISDIESELKDAV